MRNLKTWFLVALIFAATALSVSTAEAQTSVSGTQAYQAAYNSTVISFTVNFSSDSLLNAKTNLFSIANYDIGSFSWKASGTVKNFRINVYTTNFNTSDTSYWNMVNQFDTTGNYTAKPVTDTLTNAILYTQGRGLPVRYCGFQVKGLAGNRKDVILECVAVLYRKP